MRGSFRDGASGGWEKEKTPHSPCSLDLTLTETLTFVIMADHHVRRSIGEHTLRCFFLVVALFIMSLGIALSAKANLGVSPISCTPYVLSLAFPLSMGTVTILMNLSFVAVQAALLKKQFRTTHLLQIPVVLVFGALTDFSMWLTAPLEPSGYLWSALLCLFSCVVIGFGVFLQVKADAVLLAGEGMGLAFVKIFKWEFGTVKTCIDCSLVCIGLACSLMFLPGLEGIREGTVVAAVLVGMIVRFFNRHVFWPDRLLERVARSGAAEKLPPLAQTAAYAPDAPLVITIDREYGSGGHAIGNMIAERLGLQFYDSELVYLTASQSGLTPDYIRKHEQQLSSRFLHELYAQNYAYTAEELPPKDAAFLAQSKIIRDITAARACVIVGRCANFILKGRPNLFSVFLHADRVTRMQRVIANYGVKPDGAAKTMDLMDSRRRTHCLHYTGQELGNARLYDLCINTSDYGLERTADLILEAISTRTEQSPAAETAPARNPELLESDAKNIRGDFSLA